MFTKKNKSIYLFYVLVVQQYVNVLLLLLFIIYQQQLHNYYSIFKNVKMNNTYNNGCCVIM